jgi:AmiR/NasT family two-component response regulator
MLVTEVNPSSNDFDSCEGIGMFSVRSILDVVKAQSRRIDDISSQLESARLALAERKIIERAKGILTRSKRLSEQDAYTLIRKTAMQQNKRIIEVAEAIVSMADILKS